MNPQKKRIKVLLAEDHTVVREGLIALLVAEDDIDIVGEATDGRQAVGMTETLRPDVIVMDIAMPLLNGLEATRQIKKKVPATKVLILSAYSDDAYIDRVLSLGAAGYLVKHCSADYLVKAIREAQKGNQVYSPNVSKRLRVLSPTNAAKSGKAHKNKGSRLSSREVELLQLIAEGSINKEIATQLDISVKTVEKHRQALMKKLDIHDTAGLTRYAISARIIENSAQVKII